MRNTTKQCLLLFNILILVLSLFVMTGCGQGASSTTEEQQAKPEMTEEVEQTDSQVTELDAERIKEEAYEEAKSEIEAKMKAEAEAKAKADAKRKREADAKAKAEAEAKAKAEAEAKKKAETDIDVKSQREIEEKMKAIEEAKKKAELEAKKKAIEEAKRKAEEAAKNKPGGGTATPGLPATSTVVGLDGRTLKSKPNQANPNGLFGTIAVKICINQQGYVVDATLVSKGSTINDDALVKDVISNTKKWKFIDSATAPDKQCGVVNYQFKAK